LFNLSCAAMGFPKYSEKPMLPAIAIAQGYFSFLGLEKMA
jgi:hypothetical protein